MTNLLQPHELADAEHFLELARGVLDIEADAVRALRGRLGKAFLQAHRLMLETRGRVVVTGMGKSGHIGRKIASTLASTGTPAFFMHPGEASHGDLGMITADDVVIAISYSGEADEIQKVLPLIKRRRAKVIAITVRAQSTLATQADLHLDARVEKEACALNLAANVSTTAAQVLEQLSRGGHHVMLSTAGRLDGALAFRDQLAAGVVCWSSSSAPAPSGSRSSPSTA